jgi:hypothetical protein
MRKLGQSSSVLGVKSDMMKFLLGAFLTVIYLRNPTIIYRLFHVPYKIAYFSGIIFVMSYAMISLTKDKNMRIPREGVSEYLIFSIFATMFVLVSIIYNEAPDYLKSLQYLMNVFQFFVILYILVELEITCSILDIFYYIATLLSLFAIIMYIMNFFGSIVVPEVAVPYGTDGRFFYVPFEFHNFRLPEPLWYRYRSYSYFTEPSGFAMFLMPMFLYGLYKYNTTKSKGHWFKIFMIGLAIISTKSAACFVSLVITFGIYLWIEAFKGGFEKRIRYLMGSFLFIWVSVALVFAYLAHSSDNVLLFRPYTFLAWWIEMEISTRHLLSHAIGLGIGKQNVVMVAGPWGSKEWNFGGYTNFLMYAYDLGYLFLLPLLFLYFSIFIRIIRSLFVDKNPLTHTLSYMILSLLIFSFSKNVFSSPFFQTFLAIFFMSYGPKTHKYFVMRSKIS